MPNKFSEAVKKIFDTQRVGRGVKKSEARLPFTLGNFFKYLKNDFYDLFKLNMMMVFGNFPLFFGLYALTGNFNRTTITAASSLYPQLYGAVAASGGKIISPSFMALYGVHGVPTTTTVLTPLTVVFFALTALMIFTFGFVNVGTTYIMRNRLRGEPVFFFSDFFYVVKKNLRQGLLMGALDLILFAVFAYNITLSLFNLNSFLHGIVFFGNIMLLVIYIFMRFYMYILLITFDLSFWKILKNAFIFAFLGGKRNLMAALGIILVLAINYMFMYILLPLGIMLPFLITPALLTFIGMYAAWPKIRQHMIDPYYPDFDSGKDPAPENEQ